MFTDQEKRTIETALDNVVEGERRAARFALRMYAKLAEATDYLLDAVQYGEERSEKGVMRASEEMNELYAKHRAAAADLQTWRKAYDSVRTELTQVAPRQTDGEECETYLAGLEDRRRKAWLGDYDKIPGFMPYLYRAVRALAHRRLMLASVTGEQGAEVPTKMVNLTPHTVKLLNEYEDVVRTYPPSGRIARVDCRSEVVGSVDGVPLSRSTLGELTDLPPRQNGVTYIVSAMCKAAVPDRDDCVVPDRQIRDDEGRVIGCQSFRL